MPETVQTSETTLAGRTITYEVRRSHEASQSRIDVDITGVVVVLPEDAKTDPEELLQDNANWVLEKKGKYDSYRERAPNRAFEPAEPFPYLGELHEIVTERRPTSEVVAGQFRLAEHHVEQTSIKRALESLYRRKARNTFEERADNFAEQMDVKYAEIELRNQRTRWGSCSTVGTLSLNWRLMMAPLEIIDYVIVHELAHLVEQNHNQQFWEFVSEYDPDYLEHAQWLEDHSTDLIFDDSDL